MVIGVPGTQRPASRVASLARRIGLDRNPLRRGIDWAEAWLRIILALAFLAGAPFAGWGAWRWAGSVAARTVAVQLASEHRVPATVTGSAPDAGQYPYLTVPGLSWVTVRWRAPDGSRRTGYVEIPAHRRTGSIVRVWTDSAGHLASPPIQASQVRGWQLLCGLLAPLLLGLLLALCLGVGGFVAARRRMAGWEHAWSAVEPKWTRRLH
jgi:hypothetical protein